MGAIAAATLIYGFKIPINGFTSESKYILFKKLDSVFDDFENSKDSTYPLIQHKSNDFILIGFKITSLDEDSIGYDCKLLHYYDFSDIAVKYYDVLSRIKAKLPYTDCDMIVKFILFMDYQ